MESKIKFKVFRISKEKPEAFYQEYEIPNIKGMTVLEALIYIKENLDSTLSFRYSCRMGVCGSCGMYINGLPRLACHTQIAELHTNEVKVSPLPNHKIVRDLVSDLDLFFNKHKELKPYIIRKDKKELDNPTGEYLQSTQDKELYFQFSYCIKCGICYSACPTVATDFTFYGPQAMTQAFRYSKDTRDEGFKERAEKLDKSYGPWRCHFAGACAQACPKGVDPALGIQLLKREFFLDKFGLRKNKGTSVSKLGEKTATGSDKFKAPEKNI